jgi:hypothetical protein
MDTGNTALMFASYKGHLEVAKELLDRGADPNMARTDNGFTALMWASQEGHLEVGQRHVVHGANVAAKTTDGRSHNARSLAALFGRHSIVAWLNAVSGWPTFRIAVSHPASHPAEINAMLRRGVVDPDDCGGSLAAVRAAAASNTSDPTEMKRLVRLAVAGWSRHSHWLHKDAVRKAVVVSLLVACRLDDVAMPGGPMPPTPRPPAAVATVSAQAGAAAAADATGGRHPRGGARAPLPVLPPEIWEVICHFLARRHW